MGGTMLIKVPKESKISKIVTDEEGVRRVIITLPKNYKGSSEFLKVLQKHMEDGFFESFEVEEDHNFINVKIIDVKTRRRGIEVL